MKEFLNRFNLSLIIISYGAIAASLYTQINSYVLLFGIACVVWRSAHFLGRVALMPRTLLSVVAIASSLLMISLVYQQGVFSIMLHLIFLGFSLKFLELRALRDVTFFVNTGLVLIALFFIFNTSLLATFIAISLVLLLLATLLSLHHEMQLNHAFLRLLLKSCLLSLPLAMLLFVVLPRLPSLWKMPVQQQATTGLSDRVSPGEIAKLSRSSALAFRASFKGDVVPENERYWRAMTLDHFDGKTWSQGEALKQQEMMAKRGGGRSFYPLHKNASVKRKYELIIEPHYNYWIPVLDYAQTPKGLVSLTDFSLRNDRPLVARKAFSITQMHSASNGLLTKVEKQQFTQLPLATNPKIDEWISAQQLQGLNSENILQALLTLFSQRFRYTLQPPLLGDHQIDDFIFTTKAGFCVHYASSYLYVARRLGVPARMVTGYLGGEWHQSEGFFTIRQYDAHAWVEIWKDNHWLRIDPTAYVAPERVESGLAAGLTDSSEFLADEYFSLQKWQSLALLNQLRARIAQVDYLWARYVVNFDNDKQMKLIHYWLQHLPWLNLFYAVLFIMGFIFLMLLLIVFKPWQVKHVASEDKVYDALQRYFDKRHITRARGQTVSEYCLLLNERYPQLLTLSISFARNYNALKYQADLTPEQYKRKIMKLKYISKQIQFKS